MMISNLKKNLCLHGLYTNISALKGFKTNSPLYQIQCSFLLQISAFEGHKKDKDIKHLEG